MGSETVSFGQRLAQSIPPDHHVRVTIWSTAAGDHQVSLAILDEVWEGLYEDTSSIGPFHDALEVLEHLGARWAAYQRLHGVQPSLTFPPHTLPGPLKPA